MAGLLDDAVVVLFEFEVFDDLAADEVRDDDARFDASAAEVDLDEAEDCEAVGFGVLVDLLAVLEAALPPADAWAAAAAGLDEALPLDACWTRSAEADAKVASADGAETDSPLPATGAPVSASSDKCG